MGGEAPHLFPLFFGGQGLLQHPKANNLRPRIFNIGSTGLRAVVAPWCAGAEPVLDLIVAPDRRYEFTAPGLLRACRRAPVAI